MLVTLGLGQLPPRHTALAVHSHSFVIRGRRRRLRCVVSHGTDGASESAVYVVCFPNKQKKIKKIVYTGTRGVPNPPEPSVARL